ncbi:hypothetical protein FDP41_002857 [Naegleria fowleri]|uniref:Transmembrane protein n=1 Tax=Naegleria fowleri TaxID=5763 RepID=A0A6A5BUF0_NAEFO|nr:uncharacterized protein FDP41_002857 [Naegleria fowleri]KAF0978342.1 hypothetical protein FDP41_002857 [Naegleria fowleri]
MDPTKDSFQPPTPTPPPPPPFSPSSYSEEEKTFSSTTTTMRIQRLESIIPIPKPPPFSPQEEDVDPSLQQDDEKNPTRRISSEDVAKSHLPIRTAITATSSSQEETKPLPFSSSSSSLSMHSDLISECMMAMNDDITRVTSVLEEKKKEEHVTAAAPSRTNDDHDGGLVQGQEDSRLLTPPIMEDTQVSQSLPPVNMVSNIEPNAVNYSKYYNYFGGFHPVDATESCTTNSYQQQLTTQPKSQQPIVPKLDTTRFTEVNSDILPLQFETSNPQDGNKKTFSKTLGGCFACCCFGPMLCLLCFFSLIELLCIILYEYFASRNYDPNPTPQDSIIIPMILAAQFITFIVVVLCGVVSSLVATSSVCDTTLWKKETTSRFIISILAFIACVLCIVLLLVRGGMEGYTTQVLVNYKIAPATQSQNFGQVATTEFNVIPSIVIVIMFGLCVISVILCGVCGMGCLCWFGCCSICLYSNNRKKEKYQFGRPTTNHTNTYATRAVLP